MIRADNTNETALSPNTMLGLVVARSAPPSAGPIATPANRLAPSRLLAHVVSSGPATLGIAESEADQNGASATADRKPHGSSHAGSEDSAIIAKHAAPARSDTISTLRRSNRSPRIPAGGTTNPVTPNVSNRETATHAAEPVCSRIVKFSAVYAAAPPVIEMIRAVASRRTAVRGAVTE
jgi:hypothetical protein